MLGWSLCLPLWFSPISSISFSSVQRPSEVVDRYPSLAPLNSVDAAMRPKSSVNSLSLSPANLSHLVSSISITTTFALCDGSKYGNGVRAESCIDALEIIPDLGRAVSFGPRHTGSSALGTYFLIASCLEKSKLSLSAGLPYRFLSADGLCAIDVVAKPGATSDRASLWEVKQATLYAL